MSIISLAQLISAVIVIALILIQERSSGTSGIFGGSEGGAYQTRRGLEKIIFYATIFFVVLFAGTAIANLLNLSL